MSQVQLARNAAGWEPELSEALYNFFYTKEPSCQQLDFELRRLESAYEDTVYSELIHLLTHLRFEPAKAKHHWQRLVEHHGGMEGRLGSPVDLRVALVSYFVEVTRELENPTVIELQLLQQTHALAYWDELTGLRNYRFFSECLEQEILRSDKFNEPMSLIMIDIDDFKSYNDRHGHQAGNEALARIGRLLAESTRKVDIAARYGGEEFVIVAPSTGKTGALQVAERARERIEQEFADHEDATAPGAVTISAGIATYPADAAGDAELIRCADRALYLAKGDGKNQCQLFGKSRRSHRRIEATLQGRFSMVSAETVPLTTIDVSEGGIKFRTDHELAVGTLVDAFLALPGADDEIALVGRVVQASTGRSDGSNEAAIRIIEMGSAERQALARYIQQTESSET